MGSFLLTSLIYPPLYIVTELYDFLRAKSEMHARTPSSAEHALAFGETWSKTRIYTFCSNYDKMMRLLVYMRRKGLEEADFCDLDDSKNNNSYQ